MVSLLPSATASAAVATPTISNEPSYQIRNMKYVLFECLPFHFLSFLWIYFDTREACCSLDENEEIHLETEREKKKHKHTKPYIIFIFFSLEVRSFFIGSWAKREHIFMCLLCHWDSLASTFGSILSLLCHTYLCAWMRWIRAENLISSNVYHVCEWVTFFLYAHIETFCQKWIIFLRIRWEFILNREYYFNRTIRICVFVRLRAISPKSNWFPQNITQCKYLFWC